VPVFLVDCNCCRLLLLHCVQILIIKKTLNFGSLTMWLTSIGCKELTQTRNPHGGRSQFAVWYATESSWKRRYPFDYATVETYNPRCSWTISNEAADGGWPSRVVRALQTMLRASSMIMMQQFGGFCHRCRLWCCGLWLIIHYNLAGRRFIDLTVVHNTSAAVCDVRSIFRQSKLLAVLCLRA